MPINPLEVMNVKQQVQNQLVLAYAKERLTMLRENFKDKESGWSEKRFFDAFEEIISPLACFKSAEMGEATGSIRQLLQQETTSNQRDELVAKLSDFIQVISATELAIESAPGFFSSEIESAFSETPLIKVSDQISSLASSEISAGKNFFTLVSTPKEDNFESREFRPEHIFWYANPKKMKEGNISSFKELYGEFCFNSLLKVIFSPENVVSVVGARGVPDYTGVFEQACGLAADLSYLTIIAGVPVTGIVANLLFAFVSTARHYYNKIQEQKQTDQNTHLARCFYHDEAPLKTIVSGLADKIAGIYSNSIKQLSNDQANLSNFSKYLFNLHWQHLGRINAFLPELQQKFSIEEILLFSLWIETPKAQSEVVTRTGVRWNIEELLKGTDVYAKDLSISKLLVYRSDGWSDASHCGVREVNLELLEKYKKYRNVLLEKKLLKENPQHRYKVVYKDQERCPKKIDYKELEEILMTGKRLMLFKWRLEVEEFRESIEKDQLKRLMFLALTNKNFDAVLTLLEVGVDPNGKYENNPFIVYALKSVNKKIVDLLLDYGAHLDCLDSEGRSLSNYAHLFSGEEQVSLRKLINEAREVKGIKLCFMNSEEMTTNKKLTEFVKNIKESYRSFEDQYKVLSNGGIYFVQESEISEEQMAAIKPACHMVFFRDDNGLWSVYYPDVTDEHLSAFKKITAFDSDGVLEGMKTNNQRREIEDQDAIASLRKIAKQSGVPNFSPANLAEKERISSAHSDYSFLYLDIFQETSVQLSRKIERIDDFKLRSDLRLFQSLANSYDHAASRLRTESSQLFWKRNIVQNTFSIDEISDGRGKIGKIAAIEYFGGEKNFYQFFSPIFKDVKADKVRSKTIDDIDVFLFKLVSQGNSLNITAKFYKEAIKVLTLLVDLKRLDESKRIFAINRLKSQIFPEAVLESSISESVFEGSSSLSESYTQDHYKIFSESIIRGFHLSFSTAKKIDALGALVLSDFHDEYDLNLLSFLNVLSIGQAKQAAYIYLNFFKEASTEEKVAEIAERVAYKLYCRFKNSITQLELSPRGIYKLTGFIVSSVNSQLATSPLMSRNFGRSSALEDKIVDAILHHKLKFVDTIFNGRIHTQENSEIRFWTACGLLFYPYGKTQKERVSVERYSDYMGASYGEQLFSDIEEAKSYGFVSSNKKMIQFDDSAEQSENPVRLLMDLEQISLLPPEKSNRLNKLLENKQAKQVREFVLKEIDQLGREKMQDEIERLKGIDLDDLFQMIDEHLKSMGFCNPKINAYFERSEDFFSGKMISFFMKEADGKEKFKTARITAFRKEKNVVFLDTDEPFAFRVGFDFNHQFTVVNILRKEVISLKKYLENRIFDQTDMESDIEILTEMVEGNSKASFYIKPTVYSIGSKKSFKSFSKSAFQVVIKSKYESTQLKYKFTITKTGEEKHRCTGFEQMLGNLRVRKKINILDLERFKVRYSRCEQLLGDAASRFTIEFMEIDEDSSLVRIKSKLAFEYLQKELIYAMQHRSNATYIDLFLKEVSVSDSDVNEDHWALRGEIGTKLHEMTCHGYNIGIPASSPQLLRGAVFDANYARLLDKDKKMEVLRTTELLSLAFKQVNQLKGKDLVLFIGTTGAGKSTSINAISGVPLRKSENQFGKERIELDELKLNLFYRRVPSTEQILVGNIYFYINQDNDLEFACQKIAYHGQASVLPVRKIKVDFQAYTGLGITSEDLVVIYEVMNDPAMKRELTLKDKAVLFKVFGHHGYYCRLPYGSYATIGHGMLTSETTYVTGYSLFKQVPGQQLGNLRLCDCPGFVDTRGKDFDMTAMLSVDQAIQRSGSVKSVVLVIPCNAFYVDRLNPVVSALANLAELLPKAFTQADPSEYDVRESVFVLITQHDSYTENKSEEKVVNIIKNKIAAEIAENSGRDLREESLDDDPDAISRNDLIGTLLWFFNNDRVHFIDVGVAEKRSQLLRKYSAPNPIPKSEFASVMDIKELQEHLVRSIQMAFHTWQKMIMEEYDSLPKKVEMLKNEVLRLGDSHTSELKKRADVYIEREKLQFRIGEYKRSKKMVKRICEEAAGHEAVERIKEALQRSEFSQDFFSLEERIAMKKIRLEELKKQNSQRAKEIRLKNEQTKKLSDEIAQKEEKLDGLVAEIESLSKGIHACELIKKDYTEKQKLKFVKYKSGAFEEALESVRPLGIRDRLAGAHTEEVGKNKFRGRIKHFVYIEKKYSILPESPEERKLLISRGFSLSSKYKTKVEGQHYTYQVNASQSSRKKVAYIFKTYWAKEYEFVLLRVLQASGRGKEPKKIYYGLSGGQIICEVYGVDGAIKIDKRALGMPIPLRDSDFNSKVKEVIIKVLLERKKIKNINILPGFSITYEIPNEEFNSASIANKSAEKKHLLTELTNLEDQIAQSAETIDNIKKESDQNTQLIDEILEEINEYEENVDLSIGNLRKQIKIYLKRDAFELSSVDNKIFYISRNVAIYNDMLNQKNRELSLSENKLSYLAIAIKTQSSIAVLLHELAKLVLGSDFMQHVSSEHTQFKEECKSYVDYYNKNWARVFEKASDDIRLFSRASGFSSSSMPFLKFSLSEESADLPGLTLKPVVNDENCLYQSIAFLARLGKNLPKDKQVTRHLQAINYDPKNSEDVYYKVVNFLKKNTTMPLQTFSKLLRQDVQTYFILERKALQQLYPRLQGVAMDTYIDEIGRSARGAEPEIYALIHIFRRPILVIESDFTIKKENIHAIESFFLNPVINQKNKHLINLCVADPKNREKKNRLIEESLKIFEPIFIAHNSELCYYSPYVLSDDGCSYSELFSYLGVTKNADSLQSFEEGTGSDDTLPEKNVNDANPSALPTETSSQGGVRLAENRGFFFNRMVKKKNLRKNVASSEEIEVTEEQQARTPSFSTGSTPDFFAPRGLSPLESPQVEAKKSKLPRFRINK